MSELPGSLRSGDHSECVPKRYLDQMAKRIHNDEIPSLSFWDPPRSRSQPWVTPSMTVTLLERSTSKRRGHLQG